MTSQEVYNKINDILVNSEVKYSEAQQILQYFGALNDELVKAQQKIKEVGDGSSEG